MEAQKSPEISPSNSDHIQTSKEMLKKIRESLADKTTEIYSFLMTGVKAMIRGIEVLEKEFLDAISQDSGVPMDLAYKQNLHPFLLEARTVFDNLFEW